MQFSPLTVDQVILAMMACITLREAMVLLLPDSIAGPGGWLVDTGEEVDPDS